MAVFRPAMNQAEFERFLGLGFWVTGLKTGHYRVCFWI
jgi:hypothetical protein